MRRKFSVLRDPVHGDIYLSDEELALLDTPEMQRMRGVRQLDTAYLVYPGANHTRFEHMIGSCHMASRMIEAINRNRDFAPSACLGVSAEEERLVRLGALLHDATHMPFGHNVEDQTGLFQRHDTPGRIEAGLTRGELGQRLLALGVRDDVLGMLDAGPRAGQVPLAWKQIIGDTVCADIFDYLKRDAYYTGLSLSYDARLIQAFRIDRASGNLYIDVEKRGLVREDVLSEVVRMLEARYYFSERVYYHHAKIAAGALIARAVEYAIVAGLVREEDLHGRTDESLLALLESLEWADAEDGARVRRLLLRFRSRRLLKRCGVYPRHENRAHQDDLIERFFAPGRHASRAAAERKIEEEASLALGRSVDVMLYCPARRMQLKEARIHVRFPGEARVRPLADFAGRIPRLQDLEESYRNLWKFYVFSSEEEPAGIAALQRILQREIPGAVNVYRAAEQA